MVPATRNEVVALPCRRPLPGGLRIGSIDTPPLALSAVRMLRHSENAAAVAAFLEGHERVARVYYPGLSSHPGHALAARQMSGFGGIVSVALESGEAARRFAESTRLFTLAESLGGVESLVCHPETMTHAGMTPEAREIAGIGGGLLRLSVGIESEEDLVAVVAEALERAGGAPAH